MITDWPSFWDTPHFIYVNARHKDVHYRLIAAQVAALVPSATARVLDYGAGEALHADQITAAAGEVLLCDAAPGVRAGLKTRFAANAKIKVVAPEEVELLGAQSLDLVILHSVVQYLKPTQADALFALFRRLIKQDGLLVVGDVIPPDSAAATDALALLRYAAANGFLIAAVSGLVRTVFSDYRRLRGELGIARYSEAEMMQKLAAAGFAAQCDPTVIGHDRNRLAFVARPR
jgi:SAM-dependent methyltransferase